MEVLEMNFGVVTAYSLSSSCEEGITHQQYTNDIN